MIASSGCLGTVDVMQNPVKLRLLGHNVLADVRVDEHEVEAAGGLHARVV